LPLAPLDDDDDCTLLDGVQLFIETGDSGVEMTSGLADETFD